MPGFYYESFQLPIYLGHVINNNMMGPETFPGLNSFFNSWASDSFASDKRHRNAGVRAFLNPHLWKPYPAICIALPKGYLCALDFNYGWANLFYHFPDGLK
jgi:hypothetical protein